MDLEFLDALNDEWQPVSKPILMAWMAFYGLFLIYILSSGQFVITDYIFVPIHEGGHLLFRWFGETLYMLGGTLLQLGVPLALGVISSSSDRFLAQSSRLSSFSRTS